MSCKKGGFVTFCHKLRDITSTLLEVCHNAAIKPILQPVTDNNFVPLTTYTNGCARLDVSARNFWIKGQKNIF